MYNYSHVDRTYLHTGALSLSVLILQVITPLCENRVLSHEIKAYHMLGKECLWQLQRFEGIGSPWKYNHVNTGSVTSLMYIPQKFAYGS